MGTSLGYHVVSQCNRILEHISTHTPSLMLSNSWPCTSICEAIGMAQILISCSIITVWLLPTSKLFCKHILRRTKWRTELPNTHRNHRRTVGVKLPHPVFQTSPHLQWVWLLPLVQVVCSDNFSYPWRLPKKPSLGVFSSCTPKSSMLQPYICMYNIHSKAWCSLQLLLLPPTFNTIHVLL